MERRIEIQEFVFVALPSVEVLARIKFRRRNGLRKKHHIVILSEAKNLSSI